VTRDRTLRVEATATVAFLLLAPLLSPIVRPADPQARSPSEYEVKAAFVYNFARFIEWPPEAYPDGVAGLVAPLLGDDPFPGVPGEVLRGKSAQGRALATRRLRWGQDVQGCHILYVSPSERARLGQILENVRGQSILTIGDTDGFAQLGGIVNFVLEDGKVRFEINPESAGRARLRISSRLLTLARIIR